MSRVSEFAETIGPYRLVRPLGDGGGGSVWLADKLMRADGVEQTRRVAIKEARITPDEAIEQNLPNLLREFRIGALVQHPHVCAVQGIEKVGDRMYIEMEYVPGYNAAELLARLQEQGLLLPLDAVLELGAHAAAGLHALHTARDREGRPLGLVHRDVKPANILVHEAGTAKIADLGIVRGTSPQTRHTQARIVRGTLPYMSPEQHRQGDLGPPADVFSLGATLFELLTGEVLFPEDHAGDSLEAKREGEGPRRVRQSAGASEEVLELLARCVQPRPRDRFLTAEELSVALRRLRAGLQPSPGLEGLMSLLRGDLPPLDGLADGPLRAHWGRLREVARAPVLSISPKEALRLIEARELGQYSGAIRPRRASTTPRANPTRARGGPPPPDDGLGPGAQETQLTPVQVRDAHQAPPFGSTSAAPAREQGPGPGVRPPLRTAVQAEPARQEARGRVAVWGVVLGALSLVVLVLAGLLVRQRLVPEVRAWLHQPAPPPCFADADGDGVGAGAALADAPEVCGGPRFSLRADDCDDTRADVHPEAAEVVDGVDNSCDGLLAEGERDHDGDGVMAAEDCDDGDPTRHPRAVEGAADGVDQDCDGQELCWSDQDGDGWGAAQVSSALDCAVPGVTGRPGDCDDNNPHVHSAVARDGPNGLDDDCDGLFDEDAGSPARRDRPEPDRPEPPVEPPLEPPVVVERVLPSLARALSMSFKASGRKGLLSVSGTVKDPQQRCLTPRLEWTVPEGDTDSVGLKVDPTTGLFELGGQEIDRGARDGGANVSVYCTVGGVPTRLKAPDGRHTFPVPP